MAKVALVHLAHTRSGDKGDTANVGVIAYDPEHYPLLVEALTPDVVKRWFGPLVRGEVERFELPNLHALNFLLHGALGGGGTRSLMNDAQGKVFSTAILRMKIEVPDAVADAVRGQGRVPPGWNPADYGTIRAAGTAAPGASADGQPSGTGDSPSGEGRPS